MEFLESMMSGLTFWKVFGFVFCSGIVVEVVPVIKWNPITSLLQWMGKRMNKELEEKVESISKEVNGVSKDVNSVKDDLQNHKVESWRRDILNFADSISYGKCKSKEQYLYIVSLHDNYEKYIDERGLTNGQIDTAYAYIQKKYTECLENNNFYTGK